MKISDLDGWEEAPVCFLCKNNGPFHRHHKIFRSQGGSNSSDNLVLLCEVCHGAVHGIKVFKNGHSCETCPYRRKWGCYFGEKVLDEEIITEKPW